MGSFSELSLGGMVFLLLIIENHYKILICIQKEYLINIFNYILIDIRVYSDSKRLFEFKAKIYLNCIEISSIDNMLNFMTIRSSSAIISSSLAFTIFILIISFGLPIIIGIVVVSIVLVYYHETISQSSVATLRATA